MPPSAATRGQKNTQKLILSLLDTIQEHKYGPVFQNPVKKVRGAAPGGASGHADASPSRPTTTT